MASHMDISQAFGLLKPVCDRVVKNPSKENLHELEEKFPKASKEGLLHLQDYVLYPLELNLRRPDLKSEARIHLINCIKELIHHTCINNVNKFFHLYSLAFFQLFDKDSSHMVANVSEELKLSVIQCATELLQKCTENVIPEIYVKAHIPKISHGIFMCVQIMQKEKLRSLRTAAIQFLIAVTQVDEREREYDLVWRPDVADFMMFVVPGMLSGLFRVAVGDEKQGHWVTVMALRAWSRILVLVLEDVVPRNTDQNLHFSAKVTERLNTNTSSQLQTSKKAKLSKAELVEEIQSQRRSQEWAAEVAENVCKMVENLRPLQRHNHWKVRLELVEACHLILNKCHRHMSKAAVIFVEILLKLSDDVTNQVAAKSQTAIEQLAQQLEEEGGVSLFEILEENFYGLITKLPRVFHVESDDQKLNELRLLKQSIKLLGARRLLLLLQSAAHLERTLEALLQVAELQAGRISLLEDCSLRDLELNQDPALISPWKQFKHFSDKKVQEKLEEVLRLLGKCGGVEVLCNHLLDLICESEHRNEVVYLLNEILLGGCCADGTDHIVKNVLKLYLSQEIWYVPLSATGNNDSDADIPAGQARANLQLACLLVEGIGCIATGLGNRFQVFLMHTLYPVVERAGSPHESLAAAGLQAAAAVAKAVGQGEDITSLLSANMDYFMVQVTLRLRRLHESAGVLCVLSVAMKHSSKAMLPHLQEAVSDVLLKSCDTFQRHHTSSFLHVFYTFFICLKKWFVSDSNVKERIPKTKMLCDPVKFLSELSEYCQRAVVSREEDIRSAEELYSEDYVEKLAKEQLNDGMHPSEVEEEKKTEVPPHVEMTVSILQRCLHLLPGKDRQCRLLALEALQEGLEVLRDHEDQLLPVVHQVWSPLVNRLQDTSDALLLNRSFLLLCTLARLAKDFLRARTLKQVMAPLCQFLKEAASRSKLQDAGSAFRFTQLFKLQLCLLQGLGPLVADLQLQEKELQQLLSATVWYLSALQPQPLQESCVNMLKTIAAYEANAVWLEMVKIERQMTARFKDNAEYIRNTEAVLQFIHNLEDLTGKLKN